MQTKQEQDWNEAQFAVDVLLTGSAAVEVGLYVNSPGDAAATRADTERRTIAPTHERQKRLRRDGGLVAAVEDRYDRNDDPADWLERRCAKPRVAQAKETLGAIP